MLRVHRTPLYPMQWTVVGHFTLSCGSWCRSPPQAKPRSSRKG